MYYTNDTFKIRNNVHYLSSKNEKEKINNFLMSINTISFPYLSETITELESISERLRTALYKYDTKRLKLLK